MRRRTFVGLVGATAVWPVIARAQDARGPFRVGIVTGTSRQSPQMVALFEELKVFGLSEGENLTVTPGSFEVRNERLAEIIGALVRTEPDVLLCVGDPAIRIAQAATSVIPIIAFSSDLVGSRLVKSLARPGGNTTGISILAPELDGKRQDLLLEAVPTAHKIALLADLTNTTRDHVEYLQKAARMREIDTVLFTATSAEQIEPAMDAVRASGAAALNVLAAPLFSFNRKMVIAKANALSLPTIYEFPEMAEEGGLIGYGPRLPVMYRQAARLLVKVLRGVKPAEIPVEQPTTFELVVNLRTAKALALEMPAGFVLRSDRLIE